MTHAHELDIGPLSWVRGEIDEALERASEAIGKAAADVDPQTQFQFAQAHLHQVRGALSVVGLDGASQLADTLDHFVGAMARGELTPDEASTALAQRACSTLANYLGEVVGGAGDQPLRLFAIYRELARACGRGEVSAADMFFPDLERRLPRRRLTGAPAPGSDALAARLRATRAALERGLLAWLRDPANPEGASTMRDAAIALEAMQTGPVANTLWRVAQAFFDALAHGDPPASERRIKQICTALVKEVRVQAAGARRMPERLMRDLLFEIGQAPVRTDAQRTVRERWELDAWWADPGAAVADIPLGPLLRELRNEVATAKLDWDAFSAGQDASLHEFDTRIANIASESARLGRPSLHRLLDGTSRLSHWLTSNPAACDESLAIDVATALLLAELSIEGGIADGELLEQTETTLERFDAHMRGDAPRVEAPTLEVARRAHEWDARVQVTREIASSLGHIEQTLDDFFRDHAKRAPLGQLDAPLHQIEGALRVIGGDAAVPLVREAANTIDWLANGGAPDEPVLSRLADRISILGFYAGALQHGEADLNDFLPEDERRPDPDEALAPEIEFATGDDDAPQEPEAHTEAVPARAAAPEMTPAPATEAEIDAELLAIFIEEAHEVLGAIDEGLHQLQPFGDQDSLVGIRRSFHTLKGSGRMVGLTEFGEAAWAVEQTLNRWLQLEWPVTPELASLVADAHAHFDAWVAQIEGGGSHAFDVNAVVAEAERLSTLESAEAETADTLDPESVPSEASTAEPAAAPAEHADAAPAPPHFDFGDLPSLDLEEPLEATDELPVDLDSAAPRIDDDATTSVAADEAAEPSHVRIGETELSRQLFDLYVNEGRSHIETLKSSLRPLRNNPTTPSEKLLRTAHTLAGISGTAHVGPMQNLARATEFALARLREARQAPSAEQFDLFDATVERLDTMLAEVARAQLPLPVPELEQQLDAVGRPAQAELEAPEDQHEAPAAPQAQAEPEAFGEDEEAIQVRDDLDEQLLPIFLEEADELMKGLDERLRHWRDDTGSAEHPRLAARQLHTLKGSARMAGAMRLGELVHRIESRLENGMARHSPAEGLIDTLTAGLDQAAQMLADLAGGKRAPTPAAGEQAHNVESAAIAIETGESTAEAVPGGGTLRVRADHLGNFINMAGEIGIARTRIEGELRTLRRSLLDLTENVIRLRGQLREVELQAETQMQSRIAQADSQHASFDPLEMDRYTRLQELTRMMAESVGDVTTVQQNLLRNLDGAELALHGQARFARDLQQSLMQVRMVPFDSLADRLHRVVRQSAKDQGKRVNLDIRGGRIEIDRSVLERMTVAIEHMLRNAVAHGIEAQDERRAAGKEEIGQVTLTISQTGNEIAIDLADDGRGLDYEAIRTRAAERQLLEDPQAADERTLTNLIFTPGFSTVDEVSTIAGRGVGMDVVRGEAAALGGRIDVNATPGDGTRFRIYLPLTLAVTQALLVRAAHASYAIPSTMIAQVLELRSDALERMRADGFAEWQEQRYPYRYLPELLGNRRARPEIHRFNWVLLLRAGGERLALHIDAMRGNQEIVVKSAGPQLLRIVGISGATVLGDGEIVLILNPLALASRSEAPDEVMDAVLGEDLLDIGPAVEPVRQPSVMVVDDSLTVRKITGRLLEREGYRVLTAKDGTDALDQLEDFVPDVILSDIEMPRMDGFDLVRNLRADERTREVPVIMITSRLADKHREYAEKLGANDYLGKPYDEDELLRLLRQYTDLTPERSPGFSRV